MSDPPSPTPTPPPDPDAPPAPGTPDQNAPTPTPPPPDPDAPPAPGTPDQNAPTPAEKLTPTPKTDPKQKADPKQTTPAEVDPQRAWVDQRKHMGMGLGCFGIVLIAAVGFLALKHLWDAEIPPEATRSALWIFTVKLGAEAIVAVALIYLGYQILRASERMLMPHWWVTSGQIEVLRAMLGITSPVDGAAKGLQELGAEIVKETRRERSQS